jgi:hypothetical protein
MAYWLRFAILPAIGITNNLTQTDCYHATSRLQIGTGMGTANCMKTRFVPAAPKFPCRADGE